MVKERRKKDEGSVSEGNGKGIRKRGILIGDRD